MAIVIITALMLSLMLLIANIIMGKKEFQEREKPSPFECGFDPNCSARLPLSIQFFLITVIFLIFDVEITLIIPSIQLTNVSNLAPLIMMTAIFIVILLAGLYIEWQQGALDWFL